MKKLFYILIIVLIIIAVFVYLKWNNLNSQLLIDEKTSFKIESGTNAETIVNNLAAQNIIKDKTALIWYIKFKKVGDDFIAGTYWLEPAHTSIDLIDVLSGQGEVVGKITIIEGWDQMQIAAELTEQNIVSGMLFLDEVEKGDWRAESKWTIWDGKPVESDLEGYLYPDTYFFDPEDGAKGVIEKMLTNFNKKLTKDLRNEIKSQGKTVYEVLTLASIVEKEMYGEEDRRMVADVFLKRLEDGIALQSDATINYITKKGTTRPSYADLEIQDPYNTYRSKGLPPGPICNPSIESIKAVIYPKSNDYYYFLNTEDGTIIYSKTFEEHVVNKHKYLK